ncbi:GntR family transcriptional regulator [Streptosporangium sp. NPDC000396]|uniref:GntR family transcriptional regulator n=1 Tax=Streptosporangium sp. NPDC000396 TaxID=3366185 RepID=UPI0036931948
MADTTWSSVSTPYIRPRKSGEPDAWAEEAAQHGHTGTHQLREVAEVQPPHEVAQALNLSRGDAAIVRRRLVLLDGRPVELADSYYPVAIAGGTPLAEMRKIPGGAVTMLAKLGYEPRAAEEGVKARPATDQERQLLEIQPDEWVLVLTRILRTNDGTPIEATVMTMIADGRELRYKMIM